MYRFTHYSFSNSTIIIFRIQTSSNRMTRKTNLILQIHENKLLLCNNSAGFAGFWSFLEPPPTLLLSSIFGWLWCQIRCAQADALDYNCSWPILDNLQCHICFKSLAIRAKASTFVWVFRVFEEIGSFDRLYMAEVGVKTHWRSFLPKYWPFSRCSECRESNLAPLSLVQVHTMPSIIKNTVSIMGLPP